jgi:competence protein ComGC
MKLRSSNKQTAALTLMEVLVIIFVIAFAVALFLPALAAAQKNMRVSVVSVI